MFLRFIFASALALCLASCSNDAPQIPANKLPQDHTTQNLQEFNKGYVEFEEDEIQSYIDSLKIDVKRSDEGIWYQILSKGDGVKPNLMDKVTVCYSVSLLNGATFKELTDVRKEFVVGDGTAKKGFDLAARMLERGGKGKFIVPALMAYGLNGYRDCVPSLTPVICDMKLIEIEKK